MKTRLWGLMVGAAVVCASRDGRAWIESEHVEIGACTLDVLAGGDDGAKGALSALTELWAAARSSAPDLQRALCADMRIPYQRGCVSFPELVMLAGDHACSPMDLRATLPLPWTLEVTRISRETQDRLVDISDTARLLARGPSPEQREEIAAEVRSERLRVRRDLDVALQAADPDYLDRAGLAHFVHQRHARDDGDFDRYLRQVLEPSRPSQPAVLLNATAAYAGYHALAVRYASGWDQTGRTDGRLALWAILFEAFAQHFLQDSFSAGHFIDASLDSAERMGTHDHYSQRGIDVRLWSGRVEYAAHGDAYMAGVDLAHTATATTLSLRQLAFATAGVGRAISRDDRLRLADLRVPATLSTCPHPCRPKAMVYVSSEFSGLSRMEMIREVLALTPRAATFDPGYARFRAEYGMFVPLGVGLETAGLKFVDGPLVSATGVRLTAGIGYASDAVISELKDGLLFFSPVGAFGNERFAVVTFGAGFQFRFPYAYFPGDIALWAPLAAAKTNAGFEWADRAFRGGLVHYLTKNVRLQLDLGREATFLWNFRQERDPPSGTTTTQYTGWDVTIPVTTLRLVHSFSGMLGNEVLLRLAAKIGYERSRVPGSDRSDPLATGVYVGPALVLSETSRFYVSQTLPEPPPPVGGLTKRGPRR